MVEKEADAIQRHLHSYMLILRIFDAVHPPLGRQETTVFRIFWSGYAASSNSPPPWDSVFRFKSEPFRWYVWARENPIIVRTKSSVKSARWYWQTNRAMALWWVVSIALETSSHRLANRA